MRDNARPTPSLIVNPARDRRLARIAVRLLARDCTLEEFQERLRAWYPSLVVHRRELSAEPDEIWYLYREERWVPPTPKTDQPASGDPIRERP